MPPCSYPSPFPAVPQVPRLPTALTSLILQDLVEPLQRCLLLRIQVLRRDGVAQLRRRGLPRESSGLAPSQGSRQSFSEGVVKAGRRKTRGAAGSAAARYRGAPVPTPQDPGLALRARPSPGHYLVRQQAAQSRTAHQTLGLGIASLPTPPRTGPPS